MCLTRDTHYKRQTTQHGFLPSLLGDEDKGIEIVYGEKKKYFVPGPTRAVKAEINLLYRHDNPNELTKKGPLSFVLFETPFTSVLTVRRGPPQSSLCVLPVLPCPCVYHALLDTLSAISLSFSSSLWS